MPWSEADYLALQQRQRRAQNQASDPRTLSESTFLGMLKQLASVNGFLFYHTFDARRSNKGWPDCALIKPGHPLILAELKTARGKLTVEQAHWLSLLQSATGLETYLWRPGDWPAIQERLTRGK